MIKINYSDIVNPYKSYRLPVGLPVSSLRTYAFSLALTLQTQFSLAHTLRSTNQINNVSFLVVPYANNI